MAKDLFRITAKSQPCQPVVMMCRDYDQVDVPFLGRLHNLFTRDAVTELTVAVRILLLYISNDCVESVLEKCPIP